MKLKGKKQRARLFWRYELSLGGRGCEKANTNDVNFLYFLYMKNVLKYCTTHQKKSIKGVGAKTNVRRVGGATKTNNDQQVGEGVQNLKILANVLLEWPLYISTTFMCSFRHRQDQNLIDIIHFYVFWASFRIWELTTVLWTDEIFKILLPRLLYLPYLERRACKFSQHFS